MGPLLIASLAPSSKPSHAHRPMKPLFAAALTCDPLHQRVHVRMAGCRACAGCPRDDARPAGEVSTRISSAPTAISAEGKPRRCATGNPPAAPEPAPPNCRHKSPLLPRNLLWETCKFHSHIWEAADCKPLAHLGRRVCSLDGPISTLNSPELHPLARTCHPDNVPARRALS